MNKKGPYLRHEYVTPFWLVIIFYPVCYYPKNVKMNQIKILKIPFLGYIAILIWSSDRFFLPLPIPDNMDLAKPAITWKILRLRQPWMCLIALSTSPSLFYVTSCTVLSRGARAWLSWRHLNHWSSPESFLTPIGRLQEFHPYVHSHTHTREFCRIDVACGKLYSCCWNVSTSHIYQKTWVKKRESYSDTSICYFLYTKR